MKNYMHGDILVVMDELLARRLALSKRRNVTVLTEEGVSDQVFVYVPAHITTREL